MKKFALNTLVLSALWFTGGVVAKENIYGVGVDKQKVCPVMEKSLGQLFYVNVDGFGPNVIGAIHPDYIKLVKMLNIGGVVPQFGRKEPDTIQAATQALFSAPQQPLLIAINSAKIAYQGPTGNNNVSMGLGAGSGWMKSYQAKNSACFEQQTFLDAFLHKALGLNQTLGPTLDRNKHWGTQFKSDESLQRVVQKILNDHSTMGIKTTLKHFPYSPVSKTADSLNKDPVLARLGIFKRLAKNSDFILNSHLFNPNIDNKYVASLSREWVGLLKRDVGYQGLIIADAPLKLADKTTNRLTKGWLARHPKDDPKAVLVARAILAGNDMVMLQGVARDTIRLYEQVAQMACRNDPDGRLLQARIVDSYQRITKFKNNNRGVLSYRPKVDLGLINEVLGYKAQLAASSCSADEGNQFAFLQLKQRILEVR